MAGRKGATPVLVSCACKLAQVSVIGSDLEPRPSVQNPTLGSTPGCVPTHSVTPTELAVSKEGLTALLARHSRPGLSQSHHQDLAESSPQPLTKTSPTAAHALGEEAHETGNEDFRASSGHQEQGLGAEGRAPGGLAAGGDEESGSSSWSMHAFLQALRLNAFQVRVQ